MVIVEFVERKSTGTKTITQFAQNATKEYGIVTNMKVFIICPVRNLTEIENKIIQNYIADLEKIGVQVHYPPRNTNQNDCIGFNICAENMNAIKSADEVHVYWNPSSTGSLFDLGMTFALGKKIKLINEVQPTPTKSFNNVLLKVAGNKP